MSEIKSDIVEERNCCAICGGRIILDEDRAEAYCEDCGVVSEETLFNPKFELQFDGTKPGRRPWEGTKVADIPSLGNTLQLSGVDGHGRRLSHRQKVSAYRLKELDKKVILGKERMKRKLTMILNSYCNHKDVPHAIKDRAVKIAMDAHEKNLARGRSLELLAAVAVRIASSEAGVPRTLSDIVEDTNLKESKVCKFEKKIRKQFKLKGELFSPTAYLPRILSKFELPNSIRQNIYNQVVRKLEELEQDGFLNNYSPKGPLAAVLYHISNELCSGILTQREVALAVGITDVSLRAHKKRIYSNE